jgi:hypothetical protein
MLVGCGIPIEDVINGNLITKGTVVSATHLISEASFSRLLVC